MRQVGLLVGHTERPHNDTCTQSDPRYKSVFADPASTYTRLVIYISASRAQILPKRTELCVEPQPAAAGRLDGRSGVTDGVQSCLYKSPFGRQDPSAGFAGFTPQGFPRAIHHWRFQRRQRLVHQRGCYHRTVAALAAGGVP